MRYNVGIHGCEFHGLRIWNRPLTDDEILKQFKEEMDMSKKLEDGDRVRIVATKDDIPRISQLEMFGVDHEFNKECEDARDRSDSVVEFKAALIEVADTPEKRDYAMYYLGRSVEHNERIVAAMEVIRGL